MGRYPVELNRDLRPVRALCPVEWSLDWRMRPVSRSVMVIPGPAPDTGTWIRLPMPDGTAEIYRVERTVCMGEYTRLELAHGIISLQDHMLLQAWSASGTVGSALSGLLGQQGMWQAGDCGAGVSCGWRFEPGNLLQAVLRLTDPLTGDWKWQFDQNALPWTLHLRELDDSCVLRINRTLRVMEKQVDRSGLCTVMKPVGPGGMTIGSVNGGEELLFSPNRERYGQVTRIYRDMNAAEPMALKLGAQRELARREEPVESIRAEVRDFYRVTGEREDRLCPGALCSLKDGNEVIRRRIVRLKYPDLVNRQEMAELTLTNRPEDMAGEINGEGRVR